MEIENKTPEPSFFAVIPATVRYDKIPDGAKLLYGEIAALCNKKGYCWAGNEHFAELYQVNERTIRNWIDALRDKGHISVNLIYVPGKKQIQTRIIKLTCAKTTEKTKQSEKIELPENEEVGKNFSIGGEKNFHTPGNNFPQVGKNFSIGGEKNCRDNNTNNNINNTTTTTAENQPDLIKEAPPEAETAAAAVLSPEDIKTALTSIDRSLLLKTDFYSRAAAFLSLHYLDRGYFLWLYKQVELRKPNSFEGLYFKLFFADNMVEKYKISKLPEEKKPPPPPPEFKCPVCGTVHDRLDDKCPLCSLPKESESSPERIILHRELLSLSPEKRDEFLVKESLIFNSGSLHDYKKMQTETENLKKEFGVGAVHEEPSRSCHS